MQTIRHEETLIRSACKGDLAACETLWVANRRWVATIILAHRPRTVEVDDLMQEVALKFISKVDTLREPGSFRPWLRRIAINACRGAARKAKPTLRLAAGEQIEQGEVAMPESLNARGEKDVDRQDVASQVYDRVMTLPSEYREPLLMRCIQEMSYQQIGEILGLPVTTIETRLARARRMLREEMGNESIMEGMG